MQRLFRGEKVDSLPRDEALAAFTRPLEQTERNAAEEVAEAVVDEVEGYPYFIQLWGSEHAGRRCPGAPRRYLAQIAPVP